MRNTQFSLLLYGVLIAAPSLGYGTNHNPADPGPPSKPATKSAYADYVPAHDVPLQSWKEVNENAATGFGHGGNTMTAGDDAHTKKPAEHGGAKAKPAEVAGADKSTQVASAGTPIRARGVVQQIDKANAKVKLSHEPIEQLGWPKMTMFMRMKDANVADQVKTGDSVEFELEKSGSTYVVSSISRSGSEPGSNTSPPAAPKKEPAAQASVPAKAAPAAAEKAAGTGAQGIQAKGKIVQIDKASAKVKITHEPIEQIGWPKMTMFFKVKEPALLDLIKEGNDTQFTLEKVGSGYVISGFGK